MTKGEVRSQGRFRKGEICKRGTQLVVEEMRVEEKAAEVRRNGHEMDNRRTE